jgi:23S rRNA (adenine2503-C2)-methyltransferase
MEILETYGREDLAVVYVGRTGEGRRLEFVEALDPPRPRGEKWVLIVSSLYGCPVGCLMCDSGMHYEGRVPESDIIDQIDTMVRLRYPDGNVNVEKLKVHFARMGDPAFNMGVIKVLSLLNARLGNAGLIPSLSTVAPCGTDAFFDALLGVREEYYPDGNIQLQFSIHTTDPASRDELIPVKKWDFGRIARYGEEFYRSRRGRKVTLNFAPSTRYPVEPGVVARHFDPDVFLVKMTPLNPSLSSRRNLLESLIPLDPEAPVSLRLVEEFESYGFETILSIGQPEENLIRSNCGLRVMEALPGVE